MSFEMSKVEKNGKVYFRLVGHIDEDASFPVFNSLSGNVYIDLKDVKSINSVGIRSWIKWFSSFQGVHFIFQSCPKAIVMQMNMVDGFLPQNSQIESIDVPFYCEKCDKELDVHFYVGTEIKIENGQVKLDYDKKSICSESCHPELDVNEKKYFKFLLKTSASSQAA